MSNFASGIDPNLDNFFLIRKGSMYYSYDPTSNTLELITETGLTSKEKFKKYGTYYKEIDFRETVFDSLIPFDVMFFYEAMGPSKIYTLKERPRIYDPTVGGYVGPANIVVNMKDIPKEATELYMIMDVVGGWDGGLPIEMRLLTSGTPIEYANARTDTWIQIGHMTSALKDGEYIKLQCWPSNNQTLRNIAYSWR